MQLGLYTFVDNMPDPLTGKPADAAARIADVLEQAALADQLGLDVFAVGEHHRPDFAVSAPAVVLAAAAARTKSIRLSSAVTVLSSDEPVRVFQQYATLDLISRGRAEIMAGRGSFVESFPLFGLSLEDYDSLFSEKLDMLLKIREQTELTWPGGRHTPAIEGRGVYPRPLQNPLPIWLAVGGTPNSAVRAGVLGLPMALAIIGGEPQRFQSFVELFRHAARQAGRDPKSLPVGINSHGLIADDSQDAMELAYPSFKAVMDKIGAERGWPPATRQQYDQSAKLHGANFIGSPQQVIDKILKQHEWFGHDRFLLQMGVGPIGHAAMMKSIELFGTVVAPAVRKALGRS